MACGTLPPVDRQVMLFEGWIRQRLAHRADDHDTLLLRQFATWHQLPQLHAAARRAPLSAGSRNYAAKAFDQAEKLLDGSTSKACSWRRCPMGPNAARRRTAASWRTGDSSVRSSSSPTVVTTNYAHSPNGSTKG